MDSRGRLFVGDRENNRIQIFDQDGKLPRPSGASSAGRAASASPADDTIYVADSESGPDTGATSSGIKKASASAARDGVPVDASSRTRKARRADHCGAEGVGVDAQGNVYGGGRPAATDSTGGYATNSESGRRRYRRRVEREHHQDENRAPQTVFEAQGIGPTCRLHVARRCGYRLPALCREP